MISTRPMTGPSPAMATSTTAPMTSPTIAPSVAMQRQELTRNVLYIVGPTVRPAIGLYALGSPHGGSPSSRQHLPRSSARIAQPLLPTPPSTRQCRSLRVTMACTHRKLRADSDKTGTRRTVHSRLCRIIQSPQTERATQHQQPTRPQGRRKREPSPSPQRSDAAISAGSATRLDGGLEGCCRHPWPPRPTRSRQRRPGGMSSHENERPQTGVARPTSACRRC